MTDRPTDAEIEELARPFISRVGSHWEHADAIPDDGRIEEFAHTVLAASGTPPPVAPPECKTEAERTAFAFGWFKALEHARGTPPPAVAREPLTTEQIMDEASHHGFIGSREMLVKFVRGIEAAHGIQTGEKT